MLHLSEEEAMKQFEGLLNQTSLLTAVFDVIHDWYASLSLFCIWETCKLISLASLRAQYWRS